MGRILIPLSVILFCSSCVPRTLIVDHPKVVSLYFEKKIKSLERKKSLSPKQKRLLLKTKVEYGFGVLLEESDRILDHDYNLGVKKSQEAHIVFSDAKKVGNSILIISYPKLDSWLSGKTNLQFKINDVSDLYWLAAAYGGAIKSSRGNPFDVVKLPVVKKLLMTAIALDPKWGKGALYSAMMSYTSSRPDLFGDALIDSVSSFYAKALIASDSLDASLFVSYAELIDKKFQDRDAFEQKLDLALNMDVEKDKDFRLSNIIAQERAKWLLSKTDEFFFE
jgi:predicted anti-sigma-YlaC factor YlaD